MFPRYAIVVIFAVLISTATCTLSAPRYMDSPLQSENVPRLTDKKLRAIPCDECKSVAQLIANIAGNATTMNFTEGIMLQLCNESYYQNQTMNELCQLVVVTASTVLPLLIRGMTFLGWDIPLTVCADLFNSCSEPCCALPYAPEQVHLSIVNSLDLTQLQVTWVTLNDTSSELKWNASISGTGTAAELPPRTYTVGGWIGVVHTATFSKLLRGESVSYRVGSDSHGWSSMFTFSVLPLDVGTPENPLMVANIADMGYGPNSDDTVLQLTQLAQSGNIHLMVHPGDVSYADADEQHWDDYWRKVQPFAAIVPYMTTPGNHEFYWNFTAYRARVGMSMPPAGMGLPSDAMYYSLTVGPVLFVFLDTESWLDLPHISPMEAAWADAQMKANLRASVPWVISLHHRPLYCVGGNPKAFCGEDADIVRDEIEKVYLDNKVDLCIVGHMHYYQRMWPIANGVVVANNYSSPSAPVYIVNGAAGNREGQTHPSTEGPLVAAAFDNVGFAMMEIAADALKRTTYISYSFYDSSTGETLDNFTITKSY